MNTVDQLVSNINDDFRNISRSLQNMSFNHHILLEIVSDLNYLVISHESECVKQRYYQTILKKADRIGLKLQQPLSREEIENAKPVL